MHNDAFHGQGGVYIVNHDGTRKLMERTLEPWEAPSHDPAPPDDPTIPSMSPAAIGETSASSPSVDASSPSDDEPKPKAKAKIKRNS